MHRIRDRIRIRLNLIDSNSRNFEQQIIEEQYKQMKKPKNLDALLDGDLNESDKEIIPFKESDEEDEVKRCIKNNRRLMEKMNSKNYKDRVLSTYENQYDMNQTLTNWFQKVRHHEVLKEIKVKELLKDLLRKT